ncbi:MAG: hypothetical protein CBB68_02475 [Rhodospirillaceae bacterium TMED8]|nr:MAG: hypothetical protein CBB68_02475 [Rhodospirillaceae bacterium TMED8]|tara:strand:+ start:89 stop:1048 length:960 start_codon:yes stop_codon:yes gene_type:complete
MITLHARLKSITNVANGINAFELIGGGEDPLPPFTAGSHIDIHLDNGLIKQYSLCNDPDEINRYVFAVQREETGNGGSKAIHDTLRAGDYLTISIPRNNFPLAQNVENHLFLAGGIGVTPIMAMIKACQSKSLKFELIYCVRSPEKTAFLNELAKIDNVTIHNDQGDPAHSYDFSELLGNPMTGTHLYYCGPPGFMRAVKSAAANWPKGTCHFEYFTTLDKDHQPAAPENATNASFQVKLNSTGDIIDVPVNKSIADALREHGIEVQTSCESGLCGTCQIRYLEGTPEHHDLILDEETRKTDILICCARSHSPLLVLDL